MTWTAVAFVIALGAVAWIAVSAALAFGLGALVARNRTAQPQLVPATAAAAVVAHRSHVSAHAA